MIITLLTDFGIADSYVAEMKGVLLSRAPQATLVDVSHRVPVGDIRAGQYVLSPTWHQCARGTAPLAGVDPGVGTERRALVAESAGHRFLAPDNGLLSFLPADARFFALPIPSQAAPTFHGRDLFAPAAAALSLGEPVESLGTAVTDSVRAPLPIPRGEGGTIIGEIIYIDHFDDRAALASRYRQRRHDHRRDHLYRSLRHLDFEHPGDRPQTGPAHPRGW